jgi:hypothetical protein
MVVPMGGEGRRWGQDGGFRRFVAASTKLEVGMCRGLRDYNDRLVIRQFVARDLTHDLNSASRSPSMLPFPVGVAMSRELCQDKLLEILLNPCVCFAKQQVSISSFWFPSIAVSAQTFSRSNCTDATQPRQHTHGSQDLNSLSITAYLGAFRC